MSSRAPGFGVRRILVGLDGSSASLAALEAAAVVAGAAQADLLGLFVEDVRLIELASGPVSVGIHYPSGSERPLDTAGMQREMRAQASDARRALSTVAGAHRARWDFRVARGDVAAEIREAAREADLLVVGKVGRRFGGRPRLGSTALLLADAAPLPVLLQCEGARSGGTVLAVFDGSSEARRGVDLAALLAKASRATLQILIPEDARNPRALEAEAAQRAREHGVAGAPPRIIVLAPAALASALQNAAAVAVGAPPPLLGSATLRRWIDEVRCSLLLAR